jgi:hypothetical protein
MQIEATQNGADRFLGGEPSSQGVQNVEPKVNLLVILSKITGEVRDWIAPSTTVVDLEFTIPRVRSVGNMVHK